MDLAYKFNLTTGGGWQSFQNHVITLFFSKGVIITGGITNIFKLAGDEGRLVLAK